MTSVTVNGNTYNDGDIAPNNMGNGGHRTYLMPMLADTVADLAAKKASAQAAQTAAEFAAAAADSTSKAVAWVSGTSYAFGFNVYSLIDAKTYRRRVAGAGTIDPALDNTNWICITQMTEQMYAVALYF